MPGLRFTGERLVPEEADPQLLAEHVARYRFAAGAVAGRVLDLGCGTGYGSTILGAGGARAVVGVDRSAAAVAHASAEHPGRYVIADAAALPFADAAFDAVVALELIEHLARPEALVGEVRRVLAVDGTAIVSTPNRTTYVDEQVGPANEFHARELYRGELEELLAASFPHVRIYGEAVVEGVSIEALGQPVGERPALPLDASPVAPQGTPRGPLAGTPEPDYLLAFCRCADTGAPWPAGTLYVAPLEVLRRLRRERVAAERDLDEKRAWALRLRDELAERDAELRRVQRQLDEARARALRLEGELRRRGRSRERTAASPDDEAHPPGDARTLVVAAAPADVLARQLPTIEEHLAVGPVTYLLTDRQVDTLAYLHARGASVKTVRGGTRALLGAIRELRRQRFRQTIVAVSDDAGFRRVRVAGLLAGWPLALAIDEDGDVFFATTAAVLHHLAGRARALEGRSLHQARSAARMLRQRGWRATIGRVAERVGWRGSRATRAHGLLSLPWPHRPLAFDAPAEPLVSIVVAARNHWALTRRCLQLVREHTRGVDYEVILVDDGSTDATRRAEERLPGVRVLHQQNTGFLLACNRGAAVARGRFLLLLNNDVMVRPGWMQALLATFDGRPRCAAAGAKLIAVDGRLQEAGGIVWADGTAWNHGRNDDPEAPAFNYCREVDYCSAAVLMIRREAWRRVGGFDPRFAPGYWEDVDLAFALRETGLGVWYQPACAVEHLEGATAGRDESAGMKRFQVAHRTTFRDKWRSRLAAQPPFDPRRLFVARDRSRGPLAIVFDHYVPTPDRDAGSVVMDELLQTMVEEGCRVVFWPDNLYRMPGYTDRLQQRGIEVVYGRHEPREVFERMGRRADIALAYRAEIAERYLPVARDFAAGLGYLAADVEHLRESRRSAVQGVAATAVATLRAREARVVALADCVAVLSPVERDLLERELGARSVVELPLPATTSTATATPFIDRRDLLFVGSTHPPNVDGLAHFVAAVLPRVRRLLGEVTLRVVGQVAESLPGLARTPGVEAVGTVSALEPWLSTARVFVAPLRYGAGIKGKVVTALAAGLPVVTTSVGAEGLALVDGESVLIADDDESFALAVAALYRDEALWSRVAEGGRAIAAARHSRAAFRVAARQLLAELLRAGAEVGSARHAVPR